MKANQFFNQSVNFQLVRPTNSFEGELICKIMEVVNRDVTDIRTTFFKVMFKDLENVTYSYNQDKDTENIHLKFFNNSRMFLYVVVNQFTNFDLLKSVMIGKTYNNWGWDRDYDVSVKGIIKDIKATYYDLKVTITIEEENGNMRDYDVYKDCVYALCTSGRYESGGAMYNHEFFYSLT